VVHFQSTRPWVQLTL